MKKQLKVINGSYKLFRDHLKEVYKQQRKFEKVAQSYRFAVEALAARVSESEMLMEAAIGPSANNYEDQLLNATKQMQETQMSFNLQYLQLQSQMQHENRSYTAVSNIMKTKHDTVKNSISNIR